MKTTKLALIVIATIPVVIACGTSKKGASTTAASTNTTTITTTNTTKPENFVMAKPATGIFPPGDKELTAIQVQYKDVTIDILNEGHTLYTKGACVDCHKAISIYSLPIAQWKNICDDMAQRARITESQKDAVYKYVLAIKATQL